MSPDPKENVGDFDLWLTNDTQANEILGMVPPLVHGRDVSRMVSASCLQSIRAIHISGHIRTSRVPQSDSHYLIAMNDQQSHNNWAFGVEIVDSKSYDHCMIIVITTIDFTCFFISSFSPVIQSCPEDNFRLHPFCVATWRIRQIKQIISDRPRIGTSGKWTELLELSKIDAKVSEIFANKTMGKLRSHSSLKLKACVSKVSAYYPGRVKNRTDSFPPG